MAGYDQEAQARFDDMYRYFRHYPSSTSDDLMAGRQEMVDGGIVNREGAYSATDEDMDIAYALLLADKQWGSDGEINYFAQAKTVINALMEETVNQTEWTLKLGSLLANIHCVLLFNKSR